MLLTRTMFSGPKPQAPDLEINPGSLIRSASELATHDLPLLVRRADVPRRIDTGRDIAAGAVRTAVDQLPGRQRRSPWRPWMPGLAIVGVLAVIAITGIWMARGSAASSAREADRELDLDALERASNEGMPADDAATFASTPDGWSPNLGSTTPA